MLFRRAPHEIAEWPAGELRLVEAFLAREPAPDARVEVAVARLCELFVRLWSSGGGRYTVTDFLPYLRAWQRLEIDLASGRYSDIDREVLASLGATKQ